MPEQTSKDSFEIEVKTRGRIIRGDTAFDTNIEDAEITDIGLTVAKRSSHGVSWEFRSITKDVDLSNPEVQKLLSNLCDARRTDIEEELISSYHGDKE